MESIWYWASWALGLEGQDLTIWRVILRAVLVYILGIILVRLGGKRFVGKFSAFDIIMAIMIGSILSRAIMVPEDFIPHLVAAVALTLMHSLFAGAAFHWDPFGTLVKGKARVLVRDGDIQWDAMKKTHISEKDLMSALRETSSVNDVSQVREACLERSGNISVILRNDNS
ncbi:Protein of unknown function [Marinobacter daqiaonensis]|uniref:YetF C-terminal domain-containing protein n=1 Tax=Marinobacter daqiaonensis TaxID=650891 RepID=A0A1I6HI58_9GAMM|nr:YetF domain-containing protein [Marinobacter daqiaonensis]SFR54182.1 Protein of unknown function [Marinobacter daqiaonensis]